MTEQEAYEIQKKLKLISNSTLNLTKSITTIIETIIEFGEEIKAVRVENKRLSNRINELELAQEEFKHQKPLVKPFIERRKKPMVVNTPYPKPNGIIKKVLRRIVNAST